MCIRDRYFYVAENVERQARSAADVTLTQAQTYMDAKLRNVVERLFYIRYYWWMMRKKYILSL